MILSCGSTTILIIVLTVFIHLEIPSKLKAHQKVFKDHDYCYIETTKSGKILFKYNHGRQFMKVPFVYYADTESLLDKVDTCQNNREKSLTKENKQTHYLHTALVIEI